MAGTYTAEQLREVAASSLFTTGRVYSRRGNGDLSYVGARPGQGWYGHGCYARWLWVLDEGRLVRRRLWKQRWLAPSTGHTVHSRPPDEAAALWSCTIIIALKLWAWLDGEGLLTCRDAVEELETHAAPRTLQRWLVRAVDHSQELLHGLRIAVIERCEPRPVEHLFPRGLDPPEHLLRRRWRRPTETLRIWRALAWLFGGSIRLSVPACVLLAEARGRRSATETTFRS